MASSGIFQMGLVIAILGLLGPRAQAQSGCTNVLIGMAPCLNYVTGSSPSPSTSCCSQLASVVQSQPQCLCTMINGGGSAMGISINQTLAMALPGACNVKTPPVSRCDANGAPSPSPSPSPSPIPMSFQEGMSADSPNANPVSKPNSISGSKTVSSNGYGSATKIPLLLIAIVTAMNAITTI